LFADRVFFTHNSLQAHVSLRRYTAPAQYTSNVQHDGDNFCRQNDATVTP